MMRNLSVALTWKVSKQWIVCSACLMVFLKIFAFVTHDTKANQNSTYMSASEPTWWQKSEICSVYLSSQQTTARSLPLLLSKAGQQLASFCMKGRALLD